MASQSDKVAEFTGITGVDTDRAQFFLESAAWDIQTALSSFYEDDHAGDVDMPTASEMDVAPAAARSQDFPRSQPKPKFGTIGGLKNQAESSSDEEEGEAFYAGGSERGGGQQVLGPPRKKKEADEIVQNMFKAAKEHGAEEVTAGSSSGQPRPLPTFRGSGYRLGETEGMNPEDVVRGLPVAQGGRNVDLVLKLWKNGFSVDNGLLRDYNDPANKEFLTSIHTGEIPRELTKMAKGAEVNLNMEDHRTEDFVKPKVSLRAFTGEGNRLGSVAPDVTPSPSATSAGTLATDTAGGESAANASLNLDTSKPTTSLQIRLADGSRIVSKFNHTHTVGDIRNYISLARPQYAGASFVLMTTFPNKELTDDSLSLDAEKLLNAVLVQRLK